jgi:hypothetical protein
MFSFSFVSLIFLSSCINLEKDTDNTLVNQDTSEASDTAQSDTAQSENKPIEGFGEIEGDCGLLLDLSIEDNVFVIQNSIDFTDLIFLDSELSNDSQEILSDGNLNNGSIYSEVFAFELLYRCEAATLLQTETEIEYVNPNGKKTDLLISIQSQSFGVSVTRAFNYPPEDPYTFEAAETLLIDKLSDISMSSENVPAGTWSRQILSIIAYSTTHALEIENAWESLSEEVKGDTIVYITTTHGNDDFIY